MVASLISRSDLSRLTVSEAPVQAQIRHRALELARWTHAPDPGRLLSLLATAASSGGGSADSLAQANQTIDQLP